MFNITIPLNNIVSLLVHHPDYVPFIRLFQGRKKRLRRFPLHTTTFRFSFCRLSDSPTLLSIFKSLICAGKTHSKYAKRWDHHECTWWNATQNSKSQSYIDYCQDHHINYIIQHSGSIEVAAIDSLNCRMGRCTKWVSGKKRRSDRSECC